MRKAAVLFLLLALIFCTSTFAAEGTESESKPSTKIEAFTAKTGIVIIKGLSNMGSVQGLYNAEIIVDAREFYDARNSKSKEYGVTIQVKEGDRVKRESTSYIDFDEIGSLLTGIDYISKVDNKITPLNNFEASYKTRGDFSITTFSSSRGGTSAVVSSGRIGRTSAFIPMTGLSLLRDLLSKAKEKIEEIKK